MATLAEVRHEVVVSQALVRGADRRLTRALDLLDEYTGAEVPPEPPPSGTGPVYSMLAEHFFDAAEEAGWYIDSGQLLIPQSGLGLALYPTGHAGGTAPFKLERTLDGRLPRWIRGKIRLAVSPNFVGHPSGTNKVLFCCRESDTMKPCMIVRLTGVGMQPLYPGFVMQDSGEAPDGGRDINQTAVQINRDEETEIVYEIGMNTPGQANGIARLWVGGVSVLDVGDCTWAPFREPGTWGSYVHLFPIWGGATGPIVPETQTMTFTYYGIETAD